MNTIRNQLDRAKAEYHSARYPGDLASELLNLQLPNTTDSAAGRLPATASAGRRWGGGATGWWVMRGSAVAAVVAVGVFLMNGRGPNPGPYGSPETVIPMNFGTVGGAGGGVVFQQPAGANFRLTGSQLPVPPNRFDLGGDGSRLASSPSTRPGQVTPGQFVPGQFVLEPHYRPGQATPGSKTLDYTPSPR